MDTNRRVIRKAMINGRCRKARGGAGGTAWRLSGKVDQVRSRS